MRENHQIRERQEKEFEAFLPSWTADQAGLAAQQTIVSAAVRQAFPGGAILMLATKAGTLGPFALNPVVVSELAAALARTNPQYPTSPR
jgi:hypothetical protein